MKGTGMLAAALLLAGCSATDSTSPPSNPYGEGNGRVSFWTDVPIPGGISVSINGASIGAANLYFPAGEPSCGQDGTVSAIKQAGSYSFSAQSPGGITWTGSVQVRAGECVKQQLTYQGNQQPNVPGTIGGRPIQVLGTITVRRAAVVMCVWDHEVIDGDIISLFVNGSTLISNYTLTAQKRCLNVTLNSAGYSYVALYAHNEGSIPPNTAALSINDGLTGEQTYELRASLSTNGAYNIVVKP